MAFSSILCAEYVTQFDNAFMINPLLINKQTIFVAVNWFPTFFDVIQHIFSQLNSLSRKCKARAEG